jgi:tricorn protease
MRSTTLLALSLGPLSLAFSQPAVPYFTEPSVAPNRAEIAFVSGGDIWTAPLSGTEAQLLVSHPATEGRPIYSPDGTRLAFVSNRSGERNLYLLDLATSSIHRITFDDSSEQLDDWSRDGKYLYFPTSAQCPSPPIPTSASSSPLPPPRATPSPSPRAT